MTVNAILLRSATAPVKRSLSILQVGAILLAHGSALASPSLAASGAKPSSSAAVGTELAPPTPTFESAAAAGPRPSAGGGIAPECPGAATPSATASESAKAELAQLEVEKAASEARLAVTQLHHQEQLTELRSQIDTLHAQTELSATQRENRAEQLRTALSTLEAENTRLSAQHEQLEQELSISKAQTALQIQNIDQASGLAKAKRSERAFVDSDVSYRDEPFVDGVLEISDRRIALNGIITMAAADEVTERLDFYNNKSARYPIFIVIDYSPGGSVMAGYRILKAIESSRAPVHVVVKSFAASMAATITTLAPHSYAYPNAILLHHQLSGGSIGNLTEQREQLKEAEEWSRRLTEPLCKKLHLTEAQFRTEMYRHNSNGDWSEFADRAAQLGWVEHVVKGVHERGVVELPPSGGSSQPGKAQEEQLDSQGPRPKLPRLQPFDGWYLYNPDGFYG